MALVSLSRIQCMDESWVDEHIYREEVIADIQNLMETPKKELIDGQVISEGDVYDFVQCYSMVIIAKEIFESFTKESTQ